MSASRQLGVLPGLFPGAPGRLGARAQGLPHLSLLLGEPGRLGPGGPLHLGDRAAHLRLGATLLRRPTSPLGPRVGTRPGPPPAHMLEGPWNENGKDNRGNVYFGSRPSTTKRAREPTRSSGLSGRPATRRPREFLTMGFGRP